jgi:hypothetical protein
LNATSLVTYMFGAIKLIQLTTLENGSLKRSRCADQTDAMADATDFCGCIVGGFALIRYIRVIRASILP